MDKLKVLVIGSGGREHALAWKLAQSPHVVEIVCAPGNGGTANEKKCRNVDIAATDIPALVDMAIKEHFDLTVVGPEAPLVAGIVDQWPSGQLIWGPTSSAARLEGSKIFAKQVMDRFGIPTAPWRFFSNPNVAQDWLYLRDDRGLVVKADGLTGGKGAIVCGNKEEVRQAINQMSSFGEAGKRFIIEDCLEGPEASLFLMCGADGQIIPLETAQDYKRAYDGDEGPNTGGMGAYSPALHLTPEMISDIIAKHRPMIEVIGFTGFLYIGLMLTADGWKVLEYNVRMGDPETQVVLPRLESDLAEVLVTMASGKEYPEKLDWNSYVCVTVVMTAGGYPGDYRKGDVIEGLRLVETIDPIGVEVFHAGTKIIGDQIFTNGGRILDITALGQDYDKAISRAYDAVSLIEWDGEAHRTDIAADI